MTRSFTDTLKYSRYSATIMTDASSIEVSGGMPVSALEAIVSIIPTEPTQVDVYLSGELDDAALVRQANSVVPGGAYLPLHQVELSVRNPTRDVLRKIYRAGAERREAQVQLLLGFTAATWNIQGAVVKITPYDAKVGYFGKKPDFLDRLLQITAEHNVPVSIQVHPDYNENVRP